MIVVAAAKYGYLSAFWSVIDENHKFRGWWSNIFSNAANTKKLNSSQPGWELLSYKAQQKIGFSQLKPKTHAISFSFLVFLTGANIFIKGCETVQRRQWSWRTHLQHRPFRHLWKEKDGSRRGKVSSFFPIHNFIFLYILLKHKERCRRSSPVQRH